ncbi:hypothetical protein AA0Z99_01275 [Agrococcus sp. 1P02AA]|uniref:hypothetical protein n=1 Tax=Agrococcus sp. 1P02AA TaxID=3132259 RepID=UPI0039A538FE
MEPVLLLLAEWWWVAPAGASAGTVGVLGARRLGPAGRRLELDAAKQDVRDARRVLAGARAGLQRVRAELARDRADEAGPAAIAEAKRRVRHAERAVKAAVAEVAARRAAVAAARAALPAMRAPAEAMPLAQLRDAHDAVTRRWLAYETEPASALDAPAMHDTASPRLQEFLRAQRDALELRPSDGRARMRPSEFAAYRDAVARATRAFDAAERAATDARGALPGGRDPRAGWAALADDLIESAQSAVVRSIEAWQRTERDRRGRSGA